MNEGARHTCVGGDEKGSAGSLPLWRLSLSFSSLLISFSLLLTGGVLGSGSLVGAPLESM